MLLGGITLITDMLRIKYSVMLVMNVVGMSKILENELGTMFSCTARLLSIRLPRTVLDVENLNDPSVSPDRAVVLTLFRVTENELLYGHSLASARKRLTLVHNSQGCRMQARSEIWFTWNRPTAG